METTRVEEKSVQVVNVVIVPENPEKSISNLQFCLLTSVLFIGCIANGLVDTIRSITFPLMKEDLNLNYSQYGMLVGMGQFTYLIWALAIAFGMEHWGFKGPFFVIWNGLHSFILGNHVVTILCCLCYGNIG